VFFSDGPLISIALILTNGAVSIRLMRPFRNPFAALPRVQFLSFTLAIDFRSILYAAGFFACALLHES
jgi:hypothetical protein